MQEADIKNGDGRRKRKKRNRTSYGASLWCLVFILDTCLTYMCGQHAQHAQVCVFQS